MGFKFKNKTKVNISLVICSLLYVLTIALLAYCDSKNLGQFNGIIFSFGFGICLFMVLRDYKKGLICSILLMSVSFIMMIRTIILFDTLTPFTGMVNLLFYLMTLLIIGFQYRRRETEAVTDLLTGLYNRRGLYKIIKQKVEDNIPFYCIYIDFENFKFINDNLGHVYGDTAMTVVAKRIKDVVGDSGVITRIGGDEFVVLLNGREDPGVVTSNILSSVCDKISVSVYDSNVDCYLNASAGISSFPKDSTDSESLIKYADIAMYHASSVHNSTRYCFFDKTMADKLRRQLEIEHIIKEAIDNHYFYLQYQPQFTINDKKIRGFEALLRLKTPSGDMISPGEFIPVAENSDLILRIDQMVFDMALKEFKDVVIQNPEIEISINVSAKNIAREGFVEDVTKALEKSGFPASNLEIEITEYCLVQSIEQTIKNIKRFRKMGVKVALDDFGTGYTSLSYLAKMPINLLKIDKSLLDNIEEDDKNIDFVKAVINMGHIMGCEVIAEGVEAQNQLSILEEHKCDFVQGFIWGKPLDFDIAVQMCK